MATPSHFAPRRTNIRSDSVGTRRITSLDGVRGIAALVVVVHHTLLASSATLALGYEGIDVRTGSLAWWLYYTPLHLFWAGPEAVVVFFVLSGFVLALPVVKRGLASFSSSYYPKRLLRLYLPVWGALLLAVGWRALQPRVSVPGASFWLNDHAVPVTAHAGLLQASLWNENSSWAFDPVLWSLHWEVLFSLLLPVALLLGVATRRRPVVASLIGLAALVVIAVGTAKSVPTAEYLPLFLLGTLLAFHSEALRDLVSRARPMTAATVAVACLSLLTADYWIRPGWFHAVSVQPSIGGATRSAVALGAVGVIVLAIGRHGWMRFLDRRSIVWLGSRSFSLYLVHEPIVVTMTFALGGRPDALLVLLLGIPAALGVAELFWRVVERPSTQVAHRVAASWDRRNLLRGV